MSIREEQERVRAWLLSRPTLNENNSKPGEIKRLLEQEMYEVFEVLDDPEKLGYELVDVIFFCLTAATTHGLDIASLFEAKIKRNEAKYPAEYFQEGDYLEAHTKANAEWDEAGGDETWFTFHQLS